MSIRRHLILLILIAVGALLFLGATSFLQFQRNSLQVRTLTDGALPGFLSAADLSARLKDVQISVTALVYAPDGGGSLSAEALATDKKSLVDELAEQDKFAENDVQRGLVAQAQDSMANYLASIDDVVVQRKNGQKVIAEALLYGTAAQYQQELQGVLDTLRVEKRRHKEVSVAALQAGVDEASRWLFLAEAEHVVGLYYGAR